MPPVECERAIPRNELPQNDAVDGAATGTDFEFFIKPWLVQLGAESFWKLNRRLIFSSSLIVVAVVVVVVAALMDIIVIVLEVLLGYFNVPKIY